MAADGGASCRRPAPNGRTTSVGPRSTAKGAKRANRPKKRAEGIGVGAPGRDAEERHAGPGQQRVGGDQRGELPRHGVLGPGELGPGEERRTAGPQARRRRVRGQRRGGPRAGNSLRDGEPGIDEGPNASDQRADERDADPPDHPDGDRQEVAVPIALLAEETRRKQKGEGADGEPAQARFRQASRRAPARQGAPSAERARRGRGTGRRRRRTERPPRRRRRGNARAAAADRSAGRRHGRSASDGTRTATPARSARELTGDGPRRRGRLDGALAHHASRPGSVPRRERRRT